MTHRESYGIDAPGVVRALGLLGVVCIGCRFVSNHFPGASFAHNLWMTGVSALAAAGWMLVSSLWIKKRVMRSLLDQRRWRGDETVLDVGCGRGLLAIEAARRVPTGTVHGVDIWQSADLSGNSADAIRRNAVIAGVANRIEIETGRRKAISEVWRVLRPGGQILIFDIRHAKQYLEDLRHLGAMDTVLTGPIVLWGPLGWRFSAMKPC